MEKIEALVEINVRCSSFGKPVREATKLLKAYPPETIKVAVVRPETFAIGDKSVEEWCLHLYAEDEFQEWTRISFEDSAAGYQGDSPICKTWKILQMAGFDVEKETITSLKKVLYLRK